MEEYFNFLSVDIFLACKLCFPNIDHVMLSGEFSFCLNEEK